MEEDSRYSYKMESFRTEIEQLHLDKIKELKLRETNAMDRLRQKEIEVEKAAYEHRQKVLKDEELARYKENDVKKTVEMELYIVRAEKEKMAHTIHEYELKIADMEQLKLRLEKQRIEEIERFKSDYQRQFKDQDFEIHRRRLAIDEDEHRIGLEKERLARAETRMNAAESELSTLRQDFYKLQHEHQRAT